jgi:hypothetical protein
MEVALKLDWSNHEHAMTQVVKTTDHYNDVEINYCHLCNEMASQSGIPTKKHYEHPKGCKCYWCVYCDCPELVKREHTT